MQTIEHWMEWKTLCALDLCREDTRQSLRNFAHSRFRHFAGIYASITNTPDPESLTPDASEAWHRFETHFLSHRTREGKSYKEWLIGRASVHGPPTLNSIQGGAALLMREVVRERLRTEFFHPRFVSLDAPVQTVSGRKSPSLMELLPDIDNAAQAAEQADLVEIAKRDADDAMAALRHRERVALLARELGLSLVHPEVIRAAGCGKSVLCNAFDDALVGLANYVRSRYSREDNETLASLSCLLLEHVRERIFSWGKSDCACAPLLLLVEERVS